MVRVSALPVLVYRVGNESVRRGRQGEDMVTDRSVIRIRDEAGQS